MEFINTLSTLQNSTTAQDLIDSHTEVVSFYDDDMSEREENARYVAGNQWSEDELKVMNRKKKIPVVFNWLKESERTIRGVFQQNKYDVKFSPVGPEDQDQSDILNTRYNWESKRLKFDRNDMKLISQAWIGGTANQEIYVCIRDGKAIIHADIQNPFAVYWDPNSTDVGARKDAEFYDRVSFMSKETLESSFPEIDFSTLVDSEESFETITKEADRGHEHRSKRNNQFKVIERYYKVRKSEFFAKDGDNEVPIGNREERRQFSRKFPDKPIFSREEEFLFLAVACEDWQTGEYLYNGPAFSQLRDPHDNSIIWPMCELVCEEVNGKAQGFVTHLKGPQRLFNANMSNIYHASRHSASTSYGIKKSMFVSEKEAKRAKTNHSDGDQVFELNAEADQSFMMPIQQTTAAPDNGNAMNFSMQALERISSTPPAIKGQTENASTSGVLNSQRIEQSYVQLSGFISNYRDFCERRAKAMYAIWREYNQYYINETIRLIDQNKTITINQPVPEKDATGQETGRVQFLNDPTVGVYDVTFEDSFKSPTYRAKIMAQTGEIMGSPAFGVIAQQNPAAALSLATAWVESGDIAQETKNAIKKALDGAAQQAEQNSQAQAQQAQELQAVQTESAKSDAELKRLAAQKAMQDLAQAEAEQTVPNVGNLNI